MQLRRTFLLGVIGSLSLAALLGIWAFLFGNFGELEWKILFTTMTAALFSLTSLGAAVVLERARWRIAMIFAFVLSGLGLLVYLPIIWSESIWRWVDDDNLFKLMFWLAAWSISLPHAGLLSLATFKGLFRWVRRAAIAAVFALAMSVTLVALFEGEPDEELWFRIIGVFVILSTLGTITVPILAKVSGIDRNAGVESTAMEINITCPRCLMEQTVRSGHSRCAGCKLKFEINIEEPRCPKCDYLLHRLTSPTCPECGQTLGDDEITPGLRPPAALDSLETPDD
jgi:hypothetical protein